MNRRPHALRGDFRWLRPGTAPRYLSEEQVSAYNQDGFFVLEDVIDAATLEPVIAEIDLLEAQWTASLREQSEDGSLFINRADEITFSSQLVQRSELLADFCRGRLFQDLAHDLIGPDVRLYWDQAVYKKPGNPQPFPWHQDNGYIHIEPQQYLTCWVALTDATEDNGCPKVVPGCILKARCTMNIPISASIASAPSRKEWWLHRFAPEAWWCFPLSLDFQGDGSVVGSSHMIYFVRRCRTLRAVNDFPDYDIALQPASIRKGTSKALRGISLAATTPD